MEGISNPPMLLNIKIGLHILCSGDKIPSDHRLDPGTY